MRVAVAAQAFEHRPARARERLLVAVELESPVGSHLKGVELEGELRGVSIRGDLSRLLRLDDRPAENVRATPS